jgi:hypothetical protein
VQADLEGRGDGLLLDDAEGPRDDVPDDQADHAERRGHEADVGEVALDVVALVDDDGHDEQAQEDRGERADGTVHARGERRVASTDDHADRHRHQDDHEDLHHLAERHRDVVAPVVVGDHQPRDDRQGDDRDDRVDRRQADVEGDVAVEQVAHQVGGRTSRRRGQQHHPDAQHRRQVGQHDEPEADRGQQHELAGERDGDHLRPLPHSSEVLAAEAETETEHDGRQCDREADGGQGRIHGRTLVAHRHRP